MKTTVVLRNLLVAYKHNLADTIRLMLATLDNQRPWTNVITRHPSRDNETDWRQPLILHIQLLHQDDTIIAGSLIRSHSVPLLDFEASHLPFIGFQTPFAK